MEELKFSKDGAKIVKIPKRQYKGLILREFNVDCKIYVSLTNGTKFIILEEKEMEILTPYLIEGHVIKRIW